MSGDGFERPIGAGPDLVGDVRGDSSGKQGGDCCPHIPRNDLIDTVPAGDHSYNYGAPPVWKRAIVHSVL